MPKRIVISFRGAVPSTAADGARYIAQALAMKKRAEAHGATLCAWSALTFSFSFEPDELEEAVRLASMVYDGGSTGLCAGITAGDLAPIGERGSLYGLAWGMPLVRASQLSRAARPGEVLVDEIFLADRGDEIEALGFKAEGEPVKRLVPAPDRVLKTSAPPSVEPISSVASDPPPRASSPDGPPSSLSSPSSMRVPDPYVETAKRALLQGDIAALERLIAELRESGERADLVERMSGFVALRRGATADALRRLRAAAEAAKEPRQRARARLAYGVALAGAGRAESALLEALEALARAREAGDWHGEHACALFLARLSSASGHADAASVWAMIAAKAEAAKAESA
ncbi:MAG: hypothetical protein QM820_58095 [Minicystis sp.]